MTTVRKAILALTLSCFPLYASHANPIAYSGSTLLVPIPDAFGSPLIVSGDGFELIVDFDLSSPPQGTELPPIPGFVGTRVRYDLTGSVVGKIGEHEFAGSYPILYSVWNDHADPFITTVRDTLGFTIPLGDCQDPAAHVGVVAVDLSATKLDSTEFVLLDNSTGWDTVSFSLTVQPEDSPGVCAPSFTLIANGLIDSIGAETVIFREDFEAATSAGAPMGGTFGSMEREAGTFQLNALVPGWTQVGLADQFIKVNGVSGNTAILLNESGVNSLSREITGLVAGQTYRVSFEYWGDNIVGPLYGFSWEFNGETYSETAVNSGLASGNFHVVSRKFVALADSSVLKFTETNDTLASPVFDNVSITQLVQDNAPTAVAGADQSVRVGQTVQLDGTASFDDNTNSSDLQYSWTIVEAPVGSVAELSSPTSPTPTFVVDLAGSYVLELVVTDELAQSSEPSITVTSSNNLAPTAVVGADQLVVTGSTVFLNGELSSDPEDDVITFEWTIIQKPEGSGAELVGRESSRPAFVADVAGVYEVTLLVSDSIGPGDPATVVITAANASEYIDIQVVESVEAINALGTTQITTQGNQQALGNFLAQALVAKDAGDLEEAIAKLQLAIARTDGCALRGEPDIKGSGRDWIVDCQSQDLVYPQLVAALNALISEI